MTATTGGKAHASTDLEGWDPTRIKKGSRIIPTLLLLAVAIAFAVTRMPAGRDLIIDHYVRSCELVRAAKEKAPSPGAPSALVQECLNSTDNTLAAFRAKLQAMPAHQMATESASFDTKAVGFAELGRGFAAAAKSFVDDLVAAFHKHAWSGFVAIALAAVYALVPGVAGAIYRRAFWTWYALGFVAILALTSIGSSLAQFNKSKTDPTGMSDLAGGVFALVLTQLVVLLLAHRLRRQSSKPPAVAAMISPRIYNKLIAAFLWAAAIAIGWFDWGQSLWQWLPGSATFNKWNFTLLGLPLIYTLFKVTPTWAGTAPKTIVVCLDGTNNTPDQQEFGQLAQTNVFKLFRALKASERPRAEDTFDANIVKRYHDKQIGFYYVGVGTKLDNSSIGQMLGQATGLGASGVVDRAYLDVTKVYRPGDRICIFGFSRGAAISRLLARAIHQRGAPRSAWTLRLFGRHYMVWKSKPEKGVTGSVPVAVLGCWDTVGAFGIAKTIAGIDFQKVDLGKDLSVPDNVEQAYHLVALDEQRDSFVPTLMEPDPIRPGRIVEVWFSGDHANIGGGWATSKLSDVTLDFMLRQVSSGYAYDAKTMTPGAETWGIYLSAAATHNLDDLKLPPASPDAPIAPSPRLDEAALAALPPGTIVVDPDLLGQLRQWMSNLYQYQARRLPLHAVISDTVFRRMTRSDPVYAPQSLFDLNAELDKKRGAVGAAVEQLKETRSIEEWERTRVLAYRDRMQLKRWSHAHKHLGKAALDPQTQLSHAALRR